MPTRTRRRQRQIDTVQKTINDRWGAGTMLLASDPSFEITRIPCEVLSIDDLLGGGFPRDRHIEMFGPYSVGKTLLAFLLIAAAQRAGIKCAFIDAERTFDPIFAKSLGVDIKKLRINKQRISGEQCIGAMEILLRSGEYGVVVLDSIAALLPQAERDKAPEAATMGTYQARLMSAAMRRLTTANQDTAVIFINQLREAIGVMFGNRNVTSGGRALGFYAGIRLELTLSEKIKRKRKVFDPKTGEEKIADVVVGHRVLVRVQKDKTGGSTQFDTSTFVVDYIHGGIDRVEDLIYLGRKYGAVHKQGKSSWWVEGYEDEAQIGRPKFKKWLSHNTAVQEDLEEMIERNRNGRQESEEDGDDD